MKKNHSFFPADITTKEKIPIFSNPVMAGFPSPAEDHIEEKLDLNQYLISHPAATFFVKVAGESMIDAGIFPEDILIVDRSINPSDKKIIIAIIDGEFTVKRIRLIDNTILLEAENPSYPPIKIEEQWDFSVWGVVTYIIHKAH
jgi:DNA polymerase V